LKIRAWARSGLAARQAVQRIFARQGGVLAHSGSGEREARAGQDLLPPVAAAIDLAAVLAYVFAQLAAIFRAHALAARIAALASGRRARLLGRRLAALDALLAPPASAAEMARVRLRERIAGCRRPCRCQHQYRHPFHDRLLSPFALFEVCPQPVFARPSLSWGLDVIIRIPRIGVVKSCNGTYRDRYNWRRETCKNAACPRKSGQ
jgi:hypothetical protein